MLNNSSYTSKQGIYTRSAAKNDGLGRQNSMNEDLHSLGQDMRDKRSITPNLHTIDVSKKRHQPKATATVARRDKHKSSLEKNGKRGGDQSRFNESFISIDKVMEQVIASKNDSGQGQRDPSRNASPFPAYAVKTDQRLYRHGRKSSYQRQLMALAGQPVQAMEVQAGNGKQSPQLRVSEFPELKPTVNFPLAAYTHQIAASRHPSGSQTQMQAKSIQGQLEDIKQTIEALAGSSAFAEYSNIRFTSQSMNKTKDGNQKNEYAFRKKVRPQQASPKQHKLNPKAQTMLEEVAKTQSTQLQ